MDGKRYLILLGAPKCATSSLAVWLSKLPGSALSRKKETLFFTGYGAMRWTGPGAGFADGAPKSDDEFRALFDHALDADLRIEASTDNLSCESACEAIQRFAARRDVSSLKVVAITRDPVERIISEYEHTLRLGWQSGNLLNSLRLEASRRADHWNPLFHHIHRTRYASQIARFRAAFGSDLRVIDYHELSSPRVLRGLAAFAGSDARTLPDTLGHLNVRKVYSRPLVEQQLSKSPLRKHVGWLVPKAMRSRVRSILRGAPQDRYQPTREERAFILNALRPEIEACIADPEIETKHWTSLEVV
ncbi:hypothetical protein ACRDNQ_17010 [Palleronia sp. KMU-117]|uniref:hypothetical protein n=1 Tax=Palleronia sp. KMU-117 TaxID=3434108 RepID=UPI003D764F90